MPRIDTDGLDELCRQMDKDPERAEKRIDAMLIAGAQAVKAGWQKSAEENRFRRTGALIGHIDYTKKVKKMGDLKYIEIYPQGKNSKGMRYAEIAYILHWGTTGTTTWRAKARLRHKKYAGEPGIPRTLWVDRAEELSASTRVKAMMDVWTRKDD